MGFLKNKNLSNKIKNPDCFKCTDFFSFITCSGTNGSNFDLGCAWDTDSDTCHCGTPALGCCPPPEDIGAWSPGYDGPMRCRRDSDCSAGLVCREDSGGPCDTGPCQCVPMGQNLPEPQCRTNHDCHVGQLCRRGSCVSDPNYPYYSDWDEIGQGWYNPGCYDCQQWSEDTHPMVCGETSDNYEFNGEALWGVDDSPFHHWCSWGHSWGCWCDSITTEGLYPDHPNDCCLCPPDEYSNVPHSPCQCAGWPPPDPRVSCECCLDE